MKFVINPKCTSDTHLVDVVRRLNEDHADTQCDTCIYEMYVMLATDPTQDNFGCCSHLLISMIKLVNDYRVKE